MDTPSPTVVRMFAVAAIIAIALVIVYLLFFTNLLRPLNANVFNENGVYFQYPKNWTIISSSYNATSNTLFSATLIPSSLVGIIAYQNGSLIENITVTEFSEVGVVILTNTTSSGLYNKFIFNVSYVRNATYIAGYPGSEGIEYINASAFNPKSESITYTGYGNGIGYSVGAFFTLGFANITQNTLSIVTKTLKYKG